MLERLIVLSKDLQFTTSINLGEIYYGASRYKNKEVIIKAFKEKVFSNVTVLSFDSESAKIYGELKAKLEKEGKSKSEPDLRIAAIAIQHKLILVTGNVKHFSDIPSLKVENWIS